MNKITKIKNKIKTGIPIIIVDDYDRENEGDLVLAAEKANLHNLLFLMNYGKGLMCLPCEGQILDKLKIPQMRRNNNDKYGTPFSISIDAVEGTTTGMSVQDRLKTIQILTKEDSKPQELAQPGHLFPLRANPLLLKGRRGHTEASVEIVKLCGFKPISIIVEIMNNNGTMAKGKELEEYASLFNLEMISVQEIYDEIYNKGL